MSAEEVEGQNSPDMDNNPDMDADPLCPLPLGIEPIARFLNFELSDDPTYDGLELQWFDDDLHGRGMLAFLSRRADRRVDYYRQRCLRLDPGGYELGGGTGSWTETDFEVARLEVARRGRRRGAVHRCRWAPGGSSRE
jgi:hypothetical protein